jgi:hypothetical protein
MGDNAAVTPSLAKPPKTDAALVAAVDEARTVLAEMVGADVFGEHVGVVAEADRVVTHLFASTQAGYDGWRWAVTIARAPRLKQVTVNEVVLIPGEAALVAPAWVPWKDRIGKDDLGPGDLLPVTDDDPRLVPGYLVGDQALDPTTAREQRDVAREVGLGRERVLSITGRDQAADRWYAGDNGPETPIAQAAPASCATCGFLVRMAGPLSSTFGVCANGSTPTDGQVVSLDHGCGAHSDVRAEPEKRTPSTATPVLDTVSWATWETSDAGWADADVEIVSP